MKRDTAFRGRREGIDHGLQSDGVGDRNPRIVKAVDLNKDVPLGRRSPERRQVEVGIAVAVRVQSTTRDLPLVTKAVDIAVGLDRGLAEGSLMGMQVADSSLVEPPAFVYVAPTTDASPSRAGGTSSLKVPSARGRTCPSQVRPWPYEAGPEHDVTAGDFQAVDIHQASSRRCRWHDTRHCRLAVPAVEGICRQPVAEDADRCVRLTVRARWGIDRDPVRRAEVVSSDRIWRWRPLGVRHKVQTELLFS